MTILFLACALDPVQGPSVTFGDTSMPDRVADTSDSALETGSSDTQGETAEYTPDSADTVDPSDRDGDGMPADGGDCDDFDERVHPGADDPCDAVDQDCDGIAQPAHSCSELIELDGSSVGSWIGDGTSSFMFVHEADTDYNGDGVTDILAWSSCTTWGGERYCNQNVVFLPGELPIGPVSTPHENSPFWIAGAGDWTADFGNAGDFDGDGSADLFVAARGCAPDEGTFYLVLGPTERWSATGAMMRDAADGWWRQAEEFDCFADQASGGYDADGDGLGDLVVGGAQFAFVRGRSAGLEPGLPIRNEAWFEGAPDRFSLLPDIDGDGLGEVAYQEYLEDHFVVGFVPTSLLSDGTSGTPLGGVADLLEHPGYYSIDFLKGRSELGDVNADGLTDVAILAYRDYDADGEIEECSAVLTGGTTLRLDALGGRVGRSVCVDGSERGARDPDRVTDDVDGDGILDISFNRPYDGTRRRWLGCLVPSSGRPVDGWSLLDEVRPYCFGTAGDGYYAGAAVDLDADGYPEVIGSDAFFGGNRGQIIVAPGFSIPFNDSTRW